MKAALVFPRFTHPSGDPPLGLASLAGALSPIRGTEVEILDTTFERDPVAFLKKTFERERFDLVGVSLLSSMVTAGRQVTRLARAARDDTFVVMGGPHPTVMPEETLRYTGANAVCIGEAEETIVELAERPASFREIPGLAWLDGDTYSMAPPRNPIVDLDSLPPPAWHLLPMATYVRRWFQMDSVPGANPGTSLIASRGCPHRCSFCQPTLKKLFGSRLRKHSPDYMAAEVKRLKREFGIRGIMFQDDTFTIDPDWAMEVARAIHRAEPGLTWACNARADTLEPRFLSELHRCGLRKINIGIESASPRILTEVCEKNITLDQIRRTVHLAKSFGLLVQGYFMLGAPGETLEEVLATLRLSRELPLDDATFSITTPLPGTRLYDKTREWIKPGVQDYDYYTKPVYDSPRVLSPDKLKSLKRQAYIGFYLSPKRWKTTLRHLLLSGDPGKAIDKIGRLF